MTSSVIRGLPTEGRFAEPMVPIEGKGFDPPCFETYRRFSVEASAGADSMGSAEENLENFEGT